MANQGNDVPESWDDAPDDTSAAGGDTSAVTGSFAKFNVNAMEFVPSWGAAAAVTPVAPVAPVPAVPKPAAAAPAKVATTAKSAPPADAAKKSFDPVKKDGPKKEAPKKEPVPAAPKEAAEPESAGLDDELVEEEDAQPVRKAPIKKFDDGPRKEHLNIVFIGHVDAGKSTIGGHLLLQTGGVDKRTMEKNERDAKEAGRESWYLSWALDTNPEERDKGKTVEVGRSCFETSKKNFTILDAPGHKSYVQNMVEGASQADIGILVISARKGEFETGFERGGQTREHALLAKTTGVKQLVVVINKMDDPTVMWSEERYNECRDKLTPYLKQVGYNMKTDVVFMPLSGYTGANLKDPLEKSICPFYDGPSLLGYLDGLPPFPRSSDGPLRVPILGRFKEMGTVVTGKVESGSIRRGDQMLMMPNRIPVEAIQIWSDESEVDVAMGGDNVRVKLKGVEEDDVQAGFVLCDPVSPCTTGKIFDAQVAILEHKNILCAGYSAIMHMNALQEPVTISKIICLLDRRTGKLDKTDKANVLPKFIKPGQLGIIRFECADGVICMDVDTSQLSKFTLRDEGKTVGFGKIVKIIQ